MIQEVKVKQCGDGKIKKEYPLPKSMTRTMIAGLKPAGDVYIMEYLPDPVFTVIHGTTFNVRGRVDRRKIEIWYVAEEIGRCEPFILNFFKSVMNSREE